MTSSSTLGPCSILGDEAFSRGSSVLLSPTSVCCRITTLVSSGMPGMSFSAIALSSAVPYQRPAHLLPMRGDALTRFPSPVTSDKSISLPSLQSELRIVQNLDPVVLHLALPLQARLGARRDCDVETFDVQLQGVRLAPSSHERRK
jgi:hypothetical protein